MERIKGIGKIDRTSITTQKSSRLAPDYDLDGDEEIEYKRRRI